MRKNVLLLVTGSVAAIKTFEIAHLLAEDGGHTVRIVVTKHAQHFISTLDDSHRESFGADRFAIIGDDQEWNSWKQRGDPVVHIDLRKWADVAVIAPLDANTLAKLSNGQCDNLLTCIMRAWPCGSKPVVIAPAMNDAMWEHPLTAPQVDILRNIYKSKKEVHIADSEAEKESTKKNKGGLYEQVGPVRKLLMCGEYGVGAMASPEDIVAAVHRVLDFAAEQDDATKE